MPSPKKKLIAFAVSLALLVGLGTLYLHTQTSASTQESITILTIGTADSGGTMYPVGAAIADMLTQHHSNLKINISASSGSLSNAQGLAAGQIDLGLISGDIALCAYTGTDSFADQAVTELRAVAAVYSSMSNWMVLSDTGITHVHQLKGLTLALGPQDSTTELSARIGLSVSGILSSNSTFESYSLGAGCTALLDGSVDAVHGFAGVPISALDDLAQQADTALLQYTDEELSNILSTYPAYSKMVIPAGTYANQTEDISTFGVKCLLCVDASMDDALVYEITKTLAESTPTQTDAAALMSEMESPTFLWEDLSVPLHTGAARYYQEQTTVS